MLTTLCLLSLAAAPAADARNIHLVQELEEAQASRMSAAAFAIPAIPIVAGGMLALVDAFIVTAVSANAQLFLHRQGPSWPSPLGVMGLTAVGIGVVAEVILALIRHNQSEHIDALQAQLDSGGQ
jgi:hypothetical protein